ncbi:MAG: DUF4124 domain-containing protein, partial [Corallincola sp.]|nr:DUF4124 domain-containing protein [Corallincola sp.]
MKTPDLDEYNNKRVALRLASEHNIAAPRTNTRLSVATSTGKALFPIAILLTILAMTARAEVLVYFWHDSQGMIHFSAQRPTEGQIYAVHM